MQKFNTKETNKRSDLSEIDTTYEWDVYSCNQFFRFFRLEFFLKVSCYLCIQFCVSSSALSDMFYHNRERFYIQGTVLKSRSLNGKRRTLDPCEKLNPEMGRGSLQNVQKKRIYLQTKRIHPYGQVPQN